MAGGLEIHMIYRSWPRPADWERVIFIVNVEIVDYENDKFVKVAEDLELRWPAWYDSAAIKYETWEQHPEIRPLVKDQTWIVNVTEWR